MRNRILMISPYFPYPNNNGGKVRMYNLIKHLSLEKDIYLLSYIESTDKKESINEMKKYCKEVYVVERDEAERIERKDVPRCVSFFYTHKMIDKLKSVIKEIKPDLVQIDFLVMSQYINHIKNIPVIYTEHDMSNINFEQSFHDRDLSEKERFIEWGRLMKYTKKTLPKFNSVIVLTERDNKILNNFLPQCKTVLIPTGVDVDYYKPKSNKDNQENSLVYVGHYKHYPNLDAVYYFLGEIYPLILEKMNDVKVYIVGSGTPKELFKKKSDRIVITGEVADVRDYLEKAGIFIAPIRLGGGIKGKVLEAMASGIPVVATKEASEGIKCNPGKDILVAEDEKDFALKTIELIRNMDYRNKIIANSRRLVEEIYDWKKITNRLNAFYSEIVN